MFYSLSGSAQVISTENVFKSHIDYLCSESLQGRKAGSEGERKAAEYLYNRLEREGVIMLTPKSGQDFTIAGERDSIHSRNIVGIVQGYDPKLRDEYIVVGAHIDHLGTSTMKVNGNTVSQIFPGADDNASGVAALIEIAAAVSHSSFLFPRSIIFVGFGAKEQGMAGSWYFANRAFEEMPAVKAMINLDMLGRGSDSTPFSIFSQASAADLKSLMAEVENEPVLFLPEVMKKDIFPSDHLPFYDKNIPIVLFTTGIQSEYHTVKDSPKLILCNNLVDNANYIYHFLKVLASQEVIFPSLSKSEKPLGEATIFSASACDKRPQFFHSNEQHFLDSWVYKYVKYPRAAVSQGIKGVVTVSFVVEKDGSVTNVKVVNGVDELLDDEAVKVVSISPKWIPGEIKGEKVRTKIVIPVEFRLK